MTPCRTEKVDFSKKLKKQKKHKQKQNHQKNKSTGRITRRNKKKTKKKQKKSKLRKMQVLIFFVFFVFFLFFPWFWFSSLFFWFALVFFFLIFCQTQYSLCCWTHKYSVHFPLPTILQVAMESSKCLGTTLPTPTKHPLHRIAILCMEGQTHIAQLILSCHTEDQTELFGHLRLRLHEPQLLPTITMSPCSLFVRMQLCAFSESKGSIDCKTNIVHH